MTSIVLATQNQGKVGELRALVSAPGITFLGLGDLGRSFPEPEESGSTFLGNATIKAVAYARATGLVCLADDSGLIVDALGGLPGVISSHYAFDGQTHAEAALLSREERDQRNNERLLDDMGWVPDERRTARFTCTMVLAAPDGSVLATSTGELEGRIGARGQVPRGRHGFGYDPLFLVGPDYERTSAQLTPEEKNAVSHRARAVEGMVARLGSVFRNH